MTPGRVHNTRALTRVVECLLEPPESSENPVIIGIDGPDCAGKSTFAKCLMTELKSAHTVLLIHFDDFANSREIRERRGEFSVLGFRFDYFDQRALVRTLDALSCRSEIDIIIVEGLFLLTPSLSKRFSVRVRLDAAPETVLQRAMTRDVSRVKDADWVRRHYLEQCIPAQAQYVAECDPATSADILLFSCPDGNIELRR